MEKEDKGNSGDESLAITPEVVAEDNAELPVKIADEITTKEKTKEPKRSALKAIRKWTDYSRKLSERGLRQNQIKAIKVFICLPVKTIQEWADKADVVRSTLSTWWNHDKLFQECLYEAACDFLDKAIPFGMIHLGEKVMKGEEPSLMNALRLRGRLEPKQEGKGVYKRFIAEWLKPE